MPVSHDDHRRHIADVTVGIIAREGLEAATVRRIAAEVGCSTTVITHYFSDKHELLLWTYRLLGEFGVEVTDDELERFLDAEHEAWRPACRLASTTHALLEALRDRGYKTGLVSNAFDPPQLLHRDLARLGVAERLDVAVFSSEVGRRKPERPIFEHALRALEVDPERALFVGDTLATDIAGAAALGMYTCQAVWFRADEDGAAPEPDFVAFTQMDVLTVASRLSG